MLRIMEKLQRRVPAWALVAAAALAIALVVLTLLASVYLGIVIVLFALLGVAGYYAWSRLPDRFEEGADRAEERELEKHREQVGEEKRRSTGPG
jgi:membrane protein implicated in regulation of membrane protease activity